MIPSIRNPYIAQIERLEEELEAMRQRAEAAESALGYGEQWHRAVKPLSLQMTRIMRLLVARDMTAQDLLLVLEQAYPNITIGSIKVRICTIRGLLPGGLMPFKLGGVGHGYSVRDKVALLEFLRTGELPVMRRAA
jgi:hypothetical protein